MSDDLELNGRCALVTGGTQGIGEAVVAPQARDRDYSQDRSPASL
jgi:NAD(P)-dependent dehydrogenase (short-subunit alcohol dehydrogenase family)